MKYYVCMEVIPNKTGEEVSKCFLSREDAIKYVTTPDRCGIYVSRILVRSNFKDPFRPIETVEVIEI